MFNVSAFLLDDALKPATPLSKGAINENQLTFDEVKAYKKYAKILCHPDVIRNKLYTYKVYLLLLTFRQQLLPSSVYDADCRSPQYIFVSLQWRTQNFRMGGVEVPQAPRGGGHGEGYPSPQWGKGLGRGLVQENFSYFLLKIPYFDAF